MILILNGYIFDGIPFSWMQDSGVLTLLQGSNVSPYGARCCTVFVEVPKEAEVEFFSTGPNHLSAIYVSL